MEVERESVKLNLSDELIKASHSQSMKAHEQNQQHFITSSSKKHGTGSSSSSPTGVSIFAFTGLWEVNDWYHDHHFGETDVDHDLFPSLRRIGEDRLAKVNKAFLQRFQDLLKNSRFETEVQKAVNKDENILLTGHSSGGAIASFATLWILEKYKRKPGTKVPIGCVTFGSPLIGDRTLSHALRREKWADHFTHFVMEHDIVPRLMLAPKISIQEHLPHILKFFQQKVNPSNHKSHKIPKIFNRTTPKRTHYQSIEADKAVAFFENVMINASAVASYAAYDLMEPTSSLMEKLSVDFVKVSPYRPFGTYIFYTQNEAQGQVRPWQQLVVENPNAVLQLLFHFLQLTNVDQNLADFALNSLTESLGYGEELNKNEFRPQNLVNLKDLNDRLLTPNGTTGDVVSNKALSALSGTAKLCLVAAEEAEKRKKENEQLIDRSMRKHGSNQKRSKETRTEPKIIEDILDNIREYKENHAKGKMGYYDAFKLQDKQEDFMANVNRLELAKIWDVIVEMLMREDLPDEFEGRKEWVYLGTEFRQLVEPLDIANYYRHLKGKGYMGVRPKRYKFTQRWYEHRNGTRFELCSESNFMAGVEELKKDVEEPGNKTHEELKERVESIEKQVLKWEKILEKGVFLEESTWSMLRKKLPQTRSIPEPLT